VSCLYEINFDVGFKDLERTVTPTPVLPARSNILPHGQSREAVAMQWGADTVTVTEFRIRALLYQSAPPQPTPPQHK
jgi:hypothetical protein